MRLRAAAYTGQHSPQLAQLVDARGRGAGQKMKVPPLRRVVRNGGPIRTAEPSHLLHVDLYNPPIPHVS